MTLKAKEKKYEDWTMADGTKINIADMTESHLRNVLNMIVLKQKAAIEASFSSFIRKEIEGARIKNFHWKD